MPTSALAVSTPYTVTVSGLRDWTGNLQGPVTTTFTTSASATPDTTAPTVLSREPASGASGVPVDAPVGVTLSEPIRPGALTAASMPVYAIVAGQWGQVAGTYAVDAAGTTLTFTPLAPYPGATQMVVYLNADAALADLAGNLVAFQSWSFTTTTAPDTTPPTVVGVMPADGTVEVGLNATVTVTFSESLHPTTITGTTVSSSPVPSASAPAPIAPPTTASSPWPPACRPMR